MTYEELMAKRREIDDAIACIKIRAGDRYEVSKFGRTRVANKSNEWQLSIMRNVSDVGNKDTWYSIVRSEDKKVVIAAIHDLIKDLQGLYESLGGTV